MSKLLHKKNIIQKLIYYFSNDLKSFLTLTQRAQGVLPKEVVENMVGYCNERKDEILKLSNRLIELERGEHIEQKH